MKKLVVFLMLLGLMVVGSGLAQASLSWQTEPILGFSTEDTGDVIVNTRTGPVSIPHNVGPGTSMNLFYVGETVDAGSGIYYSPEGSFYTWSVVYFGPSRKQSYSGLYRGDSGEGFVMNYLDPLSTLMLADIGSWTYTETWTPIGGGESLSYTTDFRVTGVPEPASMLLFSLGLLGLAGVRRKLKK